MPSFICHNCFDFVSSFPRFFLLLYCNDPSTIYNVNLDGKRIILSSCNRLDSKL